MQVVSGTGEYFTVQTASDGIYSVPGLPAGTYRVSSEGGSMVITDAKGSYLFDNLSLGDYVIVVGDDPNGGVVGVRRTLTLLGLNADVGIVVVNYIDLVAKIVKIPLSIYSALDKLAKASAAADAAYRALKAGQDPAVAVALASLTARLAKAGPTLISLGQFMTITTQKIYKSVSSGQSPNPSDIVSVFSAVNNIGKVLASVATDAELLKGLGHVFNIAGIAFDISSAVLAWQNSGKDYNASERGIEQRLNATSDARFTDAVARLALFKSVAALKACNAGVKPGTPKPPGSPTWI